MATIYKADFQTDFGDVGLMQSNAVVDTVQNFPGLMPGRIELGDWGSNIGRAARFTIYETDAGTPSGFAGHRTEVSFLQLPKAEYWFAYDVYIPGYADFPQMFFPTTSQMLTDFSDVAIADDPIWGGYVYDGIYLPKLHGDYIQHSGKHEPCAPCVMPRGRWVRVVIHSLLSFTNGFIEVAIDGEFVLRRWNVPTIHNDAGKVYMKVGVYNINGSVGYTRACAYFRNVVITDADETWETITGGYPRRPWSPFISG